MATVEFEEVEKVYPDGTHALIDLSLRIEDGELLVVVGPSGCGKSTMLRLLAGLEPVSAGQIRIGDRVVNDLTPQVRNVAMVFQDYALYPHMTVRANLEFPLKMRRTPKDEMQRRVEWVAELLDITGSLDRRPAQLSGGQRQRVAMGRALVRNPDVFLLDEPLSNLDARLRAEVRLEIGDLQRRTGATMMYVTHDQVEAMTLGHRIAVLDKGRLQQIAPPEELYEHPANAFVAGFIGNPPMSLFPTKVVVERDAAFVLLGQSRIPVNPDALGSNADGNPVLAGIRPEGVRFVSGDLHPGSIEAVVEHVERLGHETLVDVRVGEASQEVRLAARLEAMPALAPGDTLRLAVDPAQLRLFDQDGRALRRAP